MSNANSEPQPQQEPERLNLGKSETSSDWAAVRGYDSASRDGGHYPHMPPATPYTQVGYGQRPPHERTSPLALAGFITALGSALLDLTFIFAFLGFFGAITALVLSIVGLVRDVKGQHMQGRGFAIAGIIVSAALLLLSLLFFFFFVIYAITQPDAEGSRNYAPGSNV